MHLIMEARDRFRCWRIHGLFSRVTSYHSGPGGLIIHRMTWRQWSRLLPRRVSVLVNSWLCMAKPWRRLQFSRNHVDGCTCTFADAERYTHSGHPTEDCPLRSHCGPYSDRCGGCDDCIDDQQAYYEARAKGTIR
jgi:hypothetical protein